MGLWIPHNLFCKNSKNRIGKRTHTHTQKRQVPLPKPQGLSKTERSHATLVMGCKIFESHSLACS
jgi:hypothetical protein